MTTNRGQKSINMKGAEGGVVPSTENLEGLLRMLSAGASVKALRPRERRRCLRKQEI